MATSDIEQSGQARRRIENAILIAGPTASGKSALALRVAEAVGGVIVNADSMQVYGVLDVLTARPRPHELERVPHLLYGHVPPDRSHSTGQWLREVAALAAEGRFDGRRPVFVGGTGLYFKALLDGLSAMPPIPEAVRERWRRRLREEGSDRLHRILRCEDPEAAAELQPMDGQRIVRALEVLEASGRSIRSWRGRREPSLVDPASATLLLAMPDRALLAERIDRRAETMVAEGALGEVAALLALDLDRSLPAMKAIGVAEFAAVLSRNAGVDEAVMRVKIATRQYAKRQRTWFRHQAGENWQEIQDVSANFPYGGRLAALLRRT